MAGSGSRSGDQSKKIPFEKRVSFAKVAFAFGELYASMKVGPPQDIIQSWENATHLSVIFADCNGSVWWQNSSHAQLLEKDANVNANKRSKKLYKQWPITDLVPSWPVTKGDGAPRGARTYSEGVRCVVGNAMCL